MSFNASEFDETKVQGGASPFLAPGQHTVRMLDMVLELAPFKSRDGEDNYFLRLTVEGPKIEDLGFKGWKIDPENPDLGEYEGQIGTLNHGPFAFSNFKTTDWDEQVFNWVCDYANYVGKLEKIRAIKEEDIYSFIQKVKPILCDPEEWILLTIAGKEYTNKKGFSSYRLFIPKDQDQRIKRGFAASTQTQEILDKKFLSYDPAKHLTALPPKVDAPTVENFEGKDELQDFNEALAPKQDFTPATELFSEETFKGDF